MDFTPNILQTATMTAGRLEIVEWQWPNIIDFLRKEEYLMLEMSLPPHATNASVEFPEIAPNQHSFMGTLFIRYPNIAIQGRGEGGQIRVIRCVLSSANTRSILKSVGPLDLRLLQSLLDIQSDELRTFMRLAYRELTRQVDKSSDALDALFNLIIIELRRLFSSPAYTNISGRLAGWQYNRIRERLTNSACLPTTAELAALCGISPRHLHRQFLALTGNTIAEYVENFWIEQAKTLLTHSNQSIASIAFQCGFTHANSFSRAFRRVTGMRPQTFRQSSTPF